MKRNERKKQALIIEPKQQTMVKYIERNIITTDNWNIIPKFKTFDTKKEAEEFVTKINEGKLNTDKCTLHHASII